MVAILAPRVQVPDLKGLDPIAVISWHPPSGIEDLIMQRNIPVLQQKMK